MAEQDDLPYLSPARKLIRFFRKSRDGWKAKHQDAKALIKSNRPMGNWFINA